MPARSRWSPILLASAALAPACVADPAPAPPDRARRPPDCALAQAVYRVTRVAPPLSSEAAAATALDVGGTSSPDNLFGRMIGFLYQFTVDEDATTVLADSLAARIADGELDWRLTVRSCRDATGVYAELDLGPPDPADVAGGPDGAAWEPLPAIGRVVDGSRLIVAGGLGAAPLTAFFDPLRSGPTTHRAVGNLAVDLRLADGALRGRIGFGYLGEVLDDLAPAIATYANDAGIEFFDALDMDGDGELTAAEVARSPTFLSSFAPDLDLVAAYEGEPALWPDHDGLRDSVSFGLEIAAEPI